MSRAPRGDDGQGRGIFGLKKKGATAGAAALRVQVYPRRAYSKKSATSSKKEVGVRVTSELLTTRPEPRFSFPQPPFLDDFRVADHPGAISRGGSNRYANGSLLRITR